MRAPVTETGRERPAAATGRLDGLPVLLLAVAGAYLAFLCCFVVRLQLRLRVGVEPGVPLAATLRVDSGATVPLARGPDIAEGQLTVTHVAPPSGAMESAIHLRLRTPHWGRVTREDIAVEAGDWEHERDDKHGELVSRAVGSRFSWRGVSAGLVADLARGPGEGSLLVTWNGRESRIELEHWRPSRRELKLPSPRRVFVALVSPWARQLHVSAAPTRGPGELSVVFGNETLVERTLDAGSGETDVELGAAERFRVVGQIAQHALLLAARSTVLLLVYFVAGLAVVGAGLGRLTPLERLWVPVAVGFMVLGVLTTSLGYVLPVGVGFPLVVAALVVAAILGLRGRLGEVRAHLHDAVRPTAGWRFPAATSLLSAAVMFFPALLEGGWYLGHSYTDVWYYTNLSQEFLHVPMTTVASPALTLRYGELVSLAISALVLGTDTRQVYVVEALALWTTVPFVVLSLLGRVGVRGVPARVGTVLAAFSAAWFTVFSQGFFAHYLFTFTLVWALHLTVVCFQELAAAAAAERWAIRAAAAVAYAFNVSAYPFQFFLPLCWVLALALRREAPGSHERLRELVAVGVLAVLLTNANFSVVAMYPTVSRNFGNWSDVNEIGRYLVFPYYASPEMVPVTYGVRDQVLNSRRMVPILLDLLENPAHRRRPLKAVRAVYYGAGWAVGIAALGLTLAALVACFARGAGDGALLLGLTLVTFAGSLVAFAATGQSYAVGKVGLTLGTLVLPALGVALAVLWGARRRLLVAAFAVVFLVLNLISSTLESADAYLNRKSEHLYHLRTHLPVIDVELKRLADFLAAEHRRLGRPLRVVVECRLADWHGSDHEVVLRRRIEHLAVVDGERVPLPADAPTYRVVLSEPACGAAAAEAPRFSTPLFRVYAESPS